MIDPALLSPYPDPLFNYPYYTPSYRTAGGPLGMGMPFAPGVGLFPVPLAAHTYVDPRTEAGIRTAGGPLGAPRLRPQRLARSLPPHALNSFGVSAASVPGIHRYSGSRSI